MDKALPVELARGYAAMVPKESPPWVLNTRPLTVLGMRLWEATEWQERRAHPLGFGFTPACNAADGAAITQQLGLLK